MIRIPRSAVHAVFGGALAVLAGCATPPAKPPPPAPSQLRATDRFAALDAACQAAVGCTASLGHALADGRLDVLANLSNRLAAAESVFVQCRFWDRDGAPAGEPTPWQTVKLAAGATETVHFTAADPKAAGYTVVVASQPKG